MADPDTAGGSGRRTGGPGRRTAGATALLRTVGERVRTLRRERALTLGELSARSGVSRRMISLLETGAANVSIGTLDKLARALGCDLPALVAGGDPAPLAPTAARGVAPLWEDGRGSTARLLAARRGGAAELWEWRLVGGARYEGEADPPGSEELLYVHGGRLHVEAAGARYPLAAGGFLRLPTDAPYAYVNPGSSTARFVRVLVLP